MSTGPNMQMFLTRMVILSVPCLSAMNTVSSFAFTRIPTAVRYSVSRTGPSLANIEGTTRRFTRVFSSSISDNETVNTGTTNGSAPSKKKKSTRKSRNRLRREEEERLGESQTELNWETFDFSLNPKQDHRFSNDGASIAANIGLDVEEEALEDKKHARKLEETKNAYL